MRHRGAYENRKSQQPRKQPELAEPSRRRHQEVERNRHRQDGGVQKRMTAAELRSPMIRHRTCQRIADRVEHQRNAEREARKRARQAEHLVVVEQDEDSERGVLQAFCGLPHPIRQLRRKSQLRLIHSIPPPVEGLDDADIGTAPQRAAIPVGCTSRAVSPTIGRRASNVEGDFMTAPFACPDRRVERAWIDYNGHMNMAYYNLVFDQALDARVRLTRHRGCIRTRWRRLVLHGRNSRHIRSGIETRRPVAGDVSTTRLGRKAPAFFRRDVSRGAPAISPPRPNSYRCTWI